MAFIPLDGRITSLQVLIPALAGDEVLEIVSPGNASLGNSYQVSTDVLAAFFGANIALEADSILANPTAVAGMGISVSIGATLDFVGTALQTLAITGDATSNANSFVTTVVKVNGVAYGASPAVDTIPVVTSPNVVTYSSASAVNDLLATPTEITSGATYNSVATDKRILVKKTVGSATSIVLSAAATKEGPVLVKDIKGDADVNAITVTFTGGDTADGLASVPINFKYGGYWFNPISTGNWYLTAA